MPHFLISVDHLSGENSPKATWEFSVPRIIRGENTRAASVEEVRSAVEWAYEEAGRWVDWAVPLDDLLITRLDLVADVQTGPLTDHVLRALAMQRGRRAGKAKVHRDPRLSGVESLVRGYPNRWSVEGYDKHREVLHLAERTRDPHRRNLLYRRAPSVEGVMRTEVRLRLSALQEEGVVRMAELDQERLVTTASKYRRRAGFEEVLIGSDSRRAALQALYEGPHRRCADAVVGFLVAEAEGVARRTDPKTARKYRQIAAEYGLGLMSDPLPGRSIRLNYEEHRVESSG